MAGDGGGGFGLEDVEAGPVQGARRRRRGFLGLDGEGEDALLLGEDALGGQVRLHRRDPDGSSVRRATCRGGGRVERGARVEHSVARLLDGCRPTGARDARDGSTLVAHGQEDLGSAPR